MSSMHSGVSPPILQYYERLWTQACQGTAHVTGGVAVGLFKRSGLPTQALSQIWTLADANAHGKLDKSEFISALRLIAAAQAGATPSRALLDQPPPPGAPAASFQGILGPTGGGQQQQPQQQGPPQDQLQGKQSQDAVQGFSQRPVSGSGDDGRGQSQGTNQSTYQSHGQQQQFQPNQQQQRQQPRQQPPQQQQQQQSQSQRQQQQPQQQQQQQPAHMQPRQQQQPQQQQPPPQQPQTQPNQQQQQQQRNSYPQQPQDRPLSPVVGVQNRVSRQPTAQDLPTQESPYYSQKQNAIFRQASQNSMHDGQLQQNALTKQLSQQSVHSGVPPMSVQRPASNLRPQSPVFPRAGLGNSTSQLDVSAPWSISAQEKSVSDAYFSKMKSENGEITGLEARNFLMMSKLPVSTLSQIWVLSDSNQNGKLNREEFAVAMRLVKDALDKKPIPSALPSDMIPPSRRPPSVTETTHSPAMSERSQPSHSTTQPSMPTQISQDVGPSALVPDQVTEPENCFQQNMQGSSSSVPTENAQFSMPLGLQQRPQSDEIQKNSPIEDTWIISPEMKAQSDTYFDMLLDGEKSDYLNGRQARPLLEKSGLPKSDLANVWNLVDNNRKGQLNREQFALIMYIIKKRKEEPNNVLPSELPANYVPPSLRANGFSNSRIGSPLPKSSVNTMQPRGMSSRQMPPMPIQPSPSTTNREMSPSVASQDYTGNDLGHSLPLTSTTSIPVAYDSMLGGQEQRLSAKDFDTASLPSSQALDSAPTSQFPAPFMVGASAASMTSLSNLASQKPIEPLQSTSHGSLFTSDISKLSAGDVELDTALVDTPSQGSMGSFPPPPLSPGPGEQSSSSNDDLETLPPPSEPETGLPESRKESTISTVKPAPRPSDPFINVTSARSSIADSSLRNESPSVGFGNASSVRSSFADPFSTPASTSSFGEVGIQNLGLTDSKEADAEDDENIKEANLLRVEKAKALAAAEEEARQLANKRMALDEQKSIIDREVAAMDDTLQIKLAEIQAQESALKSIEDDIVASEKIVDDKQTELAFIDSRMEAISHNKEDARQRLEHANQNSVEAELELKEMEAEITRKQSELDEMEANIESMEARCADLTSEIERIESRARELESKVAMMAIRVADTEVKLADQQAKYESVVAATDASVADAERKIADAERKIADAERKIADDETRIEMLTSGPESDSVAVDRRVDDDSVISARSIEADSNSAAYESSDNDNSNVTGAADGQADQEKEKTDLTGSPSSPTGEHPDESGVNADRTDTPSPYPQSSPSPVNSNPSSEPLSPVLSQTSRQLLPGADLVVERGFLDTELAEIGTDAGLQGDDKESTGEVNDSDNPSEQTSHGTTFAEVMHGIDAMKSSIDSNRTNDTQNSDDDPKSPAMNSDHTGIFTDVISGIESSQQDEQQKRASGDEQQMYTSDDEDIQDKNDVDDSPNIDSHDPFASDDEDSDKATNEMKLSDDHVDETFSDPFTVNDSGSNSSSESGKNVADENLNTDTHDPFASDDECADKATSEINAGSDDHVDESSKDPVDIEERSSSNSPNTPAVVENVADENHNTDTHDLFASDDDGSNSATIPGSVDETTSDHFAVEEESLKNGANSRGASDVTEDDSFGNDNASDNPFDEDDNDPFAESNEDDPFGDEDEFPSARPSKASLDPFAEGKETTGRDTFDDLPNGTEPDMPAFGDPFGDVSGNSSFNPNDDPFAAFTAPPDTTSASHGDPFGVDMPGSSPSENVPSADDSTPQNQNESELGESPVNGDDIANSADTYLFGSSSQDTGTVPQIVATDDNDTLGTAVESEPFPCTDKKVVGPSSSIPLPSDVTSKKSPGRSPGSGRRNKLKQKQSIPTYDPPPYFADAEPLELNVTPAEQPATGNQAQPPQPLGLTDSDQLQLAMEQSQKETSPAEREAAELEAAIKASTMDQ